MATWVILSIVSGFALYLATTLHRPVLVLATALATLLGMLMILLRLLYAQRINRRSRRR